VRFRDRADAGRVLAGEVAMLDVRPDMVLGLPRGGVPVARVVADALAVPLDVLVVRKLGAPGQRELAMGAVASGGVRVLNDDVIRGMGIRPDEVEAVTATERLELERREAAYRRGRPPLDVRGAAVMVVDDGFATGSTMRAAVLGVRQLGARAVIVAVPTGARATCEQLALVADRVVCASMPAPFHAVGQWYDDFTQTTDEEIARILSGHA
jgi:putative phosphoribosyl transferase